VLLPDIQVMVKILIFGVRAGINISQVTQNKCSITVL